MKTRITITLDINLEAWALNYGTGLDEDAVAEDVQAYGYNLVTEHFRAMGVLGET